MDNNSGEIVVPAPGSDEALRAGCKCPVIDNRRGRGMHEDSNGQAMFVVSELCPLHGGEGDEVRRGAPALVAGG